MQKYWHYRYRLVNHFMVVGPDAGMSIPAGVRNYTNSYNGGPTALEYSDDLVYLGDYIGVLATEYACMIRNGVGLNDPGLSHTLTELHYALNAINRLDQTSEATFPTTSYNPNPLNGYLNKTDMDYTFANYGAGTALNNNLPTGTLNGGDVGPVDECDAVFRYDPKDHFRNSPSQDHLEGLLLGLALVKALLPVTGPTGISYDDYIIDKNTGTSNNRFTEDFNGDAIAIADRIILYMRSSPFNPAPLPWNLYLPTTERLDASAGGNAWFYSPGLATAGQSITGTNYDNLFSVVLPWAFWSAIPAGSGALYASSGHNISTLTLPLKIAAIGDGWGPLTAVSIKAMGDMLDNTDYTDGKSGFASYYGMLERVLHHKYYDDPLSPQIDMCEVAVMLNQAPQGGPYCHSASPSDYAGYGWASSSRFYDDPFTQYHGNTGFPGNYNGLDYMLLHNLYYLTQTQNQDWLWVRGFYPSYTNPMGTTSSPYIPGLPHGVPILVDNLQVDNAFNMGSYGILTGSVTLNAQMDVDVTYPNKAYAYKGGIYITNTKVQQGAYFKAVCTPYAGCLPIQGQYTFDNSLYRKMNPSSNNGSNPDALPAYAPSAEFKSIASVPNGLNSYPNPTSSNLTFEFNLSSAAVCDLEIFDVYGKKVKTVFVKRSFEAGDYSIQDDLSDLNDGVYFYSLTKDNQKITKKLVKQTR